MNNSLLEIYANGVIISFFIILHNQIFSSNKWGNNIISMLFATVICSFLWVWFAVRLIILRLGYLIYLISL